MSGSWMLIFKKVKYCTQVMMTNITLTALKILQFLLKFVLGIWAYSFLTIFPFNNHCETIVRHVFYRLKQFRVSFICNYRDYRVFIYNMCTSSILEHNSSLGFPHYIQDVDMVERAQRCFTNFTWSQIWGLSLQTGTSRIKYHWVYKNIFWFGPTVQFKSVHKFIDVDPGNIFNSIQIELEAIFLRYVFSTPDWIEGRTFL